MGEPLLFKRGYAEGEQAARFPGYRYRLPIRIPITPQSVRDYTPLIEGHEYPRWIHKVGQNPPQVREIVEFSVVGFKPMRGERFWRLELTLHPNQYTQDKRPRVVLRMEVAHLNLRFAEYADMIVREAFSTPTHPAARKG